MADAVKILMEYEKDNKVYQIIECMTGGHEHAFRVIPSGSSMSFITYSSSLPYGVYDEFINTYPEHCL